MVLDLRTRLLWPSLPDGEYVERIRRHVARYRRWRWWLVGLYATLAFAFVAIVALTANVVVNLGGQFNAPGIVLGFGVGASLGLMLGFHAVTVIHGLFSVFLPLRTEQLLLRYYDALVALIDDPAGPAEKGSAAPDRP